MMMMIRNTNKKQIFKYNFNCRSSDQDVRWKKKQYKSNLKWKIYVKKINCCGQKFFKLNNASRNY